MKHLQRTRDAVLILALALLVPAYARAQCPADQCSTTKDGPADVAGTYLQAVVPDSNDKIQVDHLLTFTTDTTLAQLIIGTDFTTQGHVVVGDGVNPTTLTLDSGTDATATFHCNDGSLAIAPGSTLINVSDWDGAGYEYTGVMLFEPRCDFIAEGQMLVDGQVETVTDSGAADIVITDRNLRHLPPEFDTATMPLRVVFRDGERKGRWYDVLSVTGSTVTLDYDSRSNEARKGNPDYTTGTAVLDAGGTVVTVAGGAALELEDVLGGLWWCSAGGDTVADAVRVRTWTSTTVFTLASAYGGAGCALASPGTYVVREDNQPFPALDVSERVAPGDRYELFTPAALRSENPGAQTNLQQTSIRLQTGACPRLHYFSCEGCGGGTNNNPDDTIFNRSGILLEGLTPIVCPDALVNTVEVVDFGGLAGFECQSCDDLDLDWLFVHWASAADGANLGHGILVNDFRGNNITANVRVRNARVDRVNDDFIWFDTENDGSVVEDSIGKYGCIFSSCTSADGIDFFGDGDGLGGNAIVQRNLITNLGGEGVSRGIYFGKKTAGVQWPGGFTARDNVILNIQRGTGLGATAPVYAESNFGNEPAWFINNVIAYVEREGIQAHHHALQNIFWRHDASHNGALGGGGCTRAAYDFRSNFCVGSPLLLASDAVAAGVNISSGYNASENNYAGTSSVITDNVVVHSQWGIISDSFGHSDATYTATADPLVEHNWVTGAPDGEPLLVATLAGVAMRYPATSDVAGSNSIARDNIIQSVTGNNTEYIYYCDNAGTADLLMTNTAYSSSRTGQNPARVCTGDVSTVINAPASASGYVFTLGPNSGAAQRVTATNGVDLIGPRFAGVLRYRLPVQVPGLPPNVVQGTYDLDSDGDGLIDLWDNCPTVSNVHWLDADSDGIGDACDE